MDPHYALGGGGQKNVKKIVRPILMPIHIIWKVFNFWTPTMLWEGGVKKQTTFFLSNILANLGNYKRILFLPFQLFSFSSISNHVVYVHLAQISSFGTFPGCTPAHTVCTPAHTACTPAHTEVKSKIKLISAEAEALASARASLSLAINIKLRLLLFLIPQCCIVYLL